jgi:hypothetical protein
MNSYRGQYIQSHTDAEPSQFLCISLRGVYVEEHVVSPLEVSPSQAGVVSLINDSRYNGSTWRLLLAILEDLVTRFVRSRITVPSTS